MELLHELLPAENTIALLANPGNVNVKTDEPEIQAAADRLKQHLELLAAGTEGDLDSAFATMAQHRVGSFIVMPDPFSSRGVNILLRWQLATRCLRFIHLGHSPISAA